MAILPNLHGRNDTGPKARRLALEPLEPRVLLSGASLIATHVLNGMTVSLYDVNPANGVSAPNVAWSQAAYRAGTMDVVINSSKPNALSSITFYGDGTRTQDLGILIVGDTGGLTSVADNRKSATTASPLAPLGYIVSQGPIGTVSLKSGLQGDQLDGFPAPGGWTLPADIDGATTNLTSLYSGGTLGSASVAGAFGGTVFAQGSITTLVQATGGDLADVVSRAGSIGKVVVQSKVVAGSPVGGSILGTVRALGSITSVSATGGDIDDANGVGIAAGGTVAAVSVTGGSLFSDVTGNGSGVGKGIGTITVKGGDIDCSLLAPNGQIGAIAATGVAVFTPDPVDPQTGTGSVVGGNILGPEIHAGTSIGKITMVGGGLGDLAADDPESTLVWSAGDIGNILVQSLKYRKAVTRQDGHLVTTNAVQGGGIWTYVFTSGKLGDVTACGGDLAGTLHAAKGMGTITATSIVNQTGTWNGIAYVVDPSLEDIQVSNLTAALLAEAGADAVAIKAIQVNGGDFTGDVAVTGGVGKIATKGYATVDTRTGEADLTLAGGGFLSKSFEASSLAGISLGTGDFGAGVHVAGSVGAVTLTGGDFRGLLQADQAVGAITLAGFAGKLASLKGLAVNLADSGQAVSDFSGRVTAGTTLGGLSIVGGNLDQGLLAAGTQIGNIVLKAVTTDAKAVWNDGLGDYDITPGQVYGTAFDLAIQITGHPTSAKPMGDITGTGVDVYVTATLPRAAGPARIVDAASTRFDGTGTKPFLFTIKSTATRYVQTFNVNYPGNPDARPTVTKQYAPLPDSSGTVTEAITWT